MQIDREKLRSPGNHCRILLVGIGSAGCNTLGTLIEHGIDLPDSVAIHTDAQALEASQAPRQLPLGDGFSTGGDVMRGKACAETAKEKLRDLFGHYRLVFFVVGLGGGTGNGAAPVFVQLARECGAFTLCMAVMPFAFEGERKKLKAESGLATLRETSDGVICFPNQRLFQLMAEDTSYVNALRAADEVLSRGLLRLWKLLNEPGVMNLDFADVAALVRHSNGTCTLASIAKDGDRRVRDAIDAILTDVLFARGTVITQARALLIGIVAGPELSLVEVERIHHEIGKVCRPDVVFFTGVTVLEEMRDRISITALASETWIADAEPDHAAAGEGVLMQEDLGLEPASPAGFRGTTPSQHDGENLDIPTYLRRGITLSH